MAEAWRRESVAGINKEGVTDKMAKALEGLKVVEVGNILAGPFAGTLMADFGAEVIKVEPPKEGDLMRNMGRIKDLWFAVEGRNKKSVTLNLKEKRGKEILIELLKDADVLIENFRPGVFKKLGFTWEMLHDLNPRLVFYSASGYGQTGPCSHKPGFDRIGLALGGFLHVTGFPGEPPIKPGVSVADFMTAMFGTIGIMFAIYHRDVIGTGLGQRIDGCLTETTLRMMESIIAEYSYDGSIRNRVGNGTLVTIPSGHFLTKDDQYFVLSVAGDKVFEQFAKGIGREDLLQSEEYRTAKGRMKNREEINQIAEDWCRAHTIEECMAAMGDEVPNCKVYTAADIVKDPHFAAREALIQVPTKKFGVLTMQNVTPKLSDTPGKVEWAGPELGANNEEIYLEKLKMTKEELAKLQANGVV
jgi:crotonobetainyl-CoA:carnitine CoA-transferase CaiB-like acyl-CoA transferase